jgi:hypothetical protein
MNSYLWGGYLCWHDRSFKEFIDSRADIFVYAGVFQDYISLLGLNDSAAILDKYGIRYVLYSPNEPLTYVLEHDPNWKVIFRGKVSMMLERVGPAPAPRVNRPAPSESMYAW